MIDSSSHILQFGRIAEMKAESSAYLSGSPASEVQYIAITDLISEGPIYGLANGTSSLFFDNDTVADPKNSCQLYSQTSAVITLTQNSTAGVVSNLGSPIKNNESIVLPQTADHGKKYLIVRGGALQNSPVQVIPTIQGEHNIIFNSGVLNTSMISIDAVYESSTDGDATSAPKFRQKHTRITDSFLKDTYPGILTRQSATNSAIWVPGFPGTKSNIILERFPLNNTRYTIDIDAPVGISSILGNGSIVLDTAWTGPTGTYKFDITSPFFGVEDLADAEPTVSYEGTRLQFRTGNLIQPPVKGQGGTGVTTISNTPSGLPELEQVVGYGLAHPNSNKADTDVADTLATEIQGTSSTGFSLTAEQVKYVDEIKVTFSYSALYRIDESGKPQGTVAAYMAELLFKDIGSSTFNRSSGDLGREGIPNIWAFPHIRHGALRSKGNTNACTFVERFDLTAFKPFQDFKLVIKRITTATSNNGAYTTSSGYNQGKGQHQASSSITNVTSIIKEKTSNPYTAYAKTQFSSKQFTKMPQRSYHVKGMLIHVPKNYVTRDEAGSISANYNRNTSTGVVESSYQAWDGSLREDPVYCNNPAWVFHDLVTNDRYGLGEYIKLRMSSLFADLDLYALYRIGRYCDELVTTKYNTQEPRFTCNTLLSGPMDAFKVLRDFGTIFRSAIYWYNSKITPVLDGPKDPVYTFSKSNVYSEGFSYESTGIKARPNQIHVVYNNPDQNYEAQTLVVEDKSNIASKNKIIAKSVVAFGCTSETQALRYARWHLYSAINQTEIVNFKTGIAGVFLMPGDVVKIQDADRNSIRLSGRLKATPSTSILPLDAPVSFGSTSTYKATVVVTSPAAFLLDSSVVINSITYLKGDVVTQGYFNGSLVDLDTEEKAANFTTTSAGTIPVNVTWSPYTHVETRDVLNTHSSIVSFTSNDTHGGGRTPGIYQNIQQSIPVASGGTGAKFNAVVSGIGTVTWTMIHPGNGYAEGDALVFVDSLFGSGGDASVTLTVTEIGTSSLLYVQTPFSVAPVTESLWILERFVGGVLVADQAKNYQLINIVAEEDGFSMSATPYNDSKFNYVETGFNLGVTDVTLPASLAVDTIPPVLDFGFTLVTSPTTTTEQVELNWVPPSFEKISSFEITHNVIGIPSPIIKNSNETSHLFDQEIETTQLIATIRVLNDIGNRSPGVALSSPIIPIAADTISRFVEGLPYGGTANIAFSISSGGLAAFVSPAWTVTPPGATSVPIVNTGTSVATYQQDCSGVPAITYDDSDASGFEDEFHYIVVDASDTTDRLKLIKFAVGGEGKVPYWYDTGNGSTTQSQGFATAFAGTISIDASSSIVTGTGTAFETDFIRGDIIKFTDPSARVYIANVSTVISNTELRLNYTPPTSINNSTYQTSNFRPDPTRDTIIAHLYKPA